MFSCLHAQKIADVANGSDLDGSSAGAKLPPDTGDVGIEGIGFDFVIQRIDRLNQHRTRDDAICPPHQRFDHKIFPPRQIDETALNRDFVAARIKGEIAERELRARDDR